MGGQNVISSQGGLAGRCYGKSTGLVSIGLIIGFLDWGWFAAEIWAERSEQIPCQGTEALEQPQRLTVCRSCLPKAAAGELSRAWWFSQIHQSERLLFPLGMETETRRVLGNCTWRAIRSCKRLLLVHIQGQFVWLGKIWEASFRIGNEKGKYQVKTTAIFGILFSY